MAEYIERDMLLKMISHKPSSPTTEREDRLIDGFISAVKNCPASAVRPVVLCRDCRNWDTDWTPTHARKNEHFCPNIGLTTREDWFCADGEKREES